MELRRRESASGLEWTPLTCQGYTRAPPEKRLRPASEMARPPLRRSEASMGPGCPPPDDVTAIPPFGPVHCVSDLLFTVNVFSCVAAPCIAPEVEARFLLPFQELIVTEADPPRRWLQGRRSASQKYYIPP